MVVVAVAAVIVAILVEVVLVVAVKVAVAVNTVFKTKSNITNTTEKVYYITMLNSFHDQSLHWLQVCLASRE